MSPSYSTVVPHRNEHCRTVRHEYERHHRHSSTDRGRSTCPYSTDCHERRDSCDFECTNRPCSCECSDCSTGCSHRPSSSCSTCLDVHSSSCHTRQRACSRTIGTEGPVRRVSGGRRCDLTWSSSVLDHYVIQRIMTWCDELIRL